MGEEVMEGVLDPGEDVTETVGKDTEIEEVIESDGPTIEDLAKEQGWKPQDDFTGHKDDYVDPVEYIRRGKPIQDGMRKHLKDTRRAMANMEQGLEDLQDHNSQVQNAQETRHRAEIAKLRKERRTAIEDGDPDLVEDIEERLGEEYSSIPGPRRPPTPRVNHDDEESFDNWRNGNSWYGSDRELTEYCDSQADLPRYRGLSYEKKLSRVTGAVKKMFPDKFKGTLKVPRVATVESGKPAGTGKQTKNYSSKDLSDEERSVMNNFVRIKAFDTKDKKLTDTQARQKYMTDRAAMKEAIS